MENASLSEVGLHRVLAWGPVSVEGLDGVESIQPHLTECHPFAFCCHLCACASQVTIRIRMHTGTWLVCRRNFMTPPSHSSPYRIELSSYCREISMFLPHVLILPI